VLFPECHCDAPSMCLRNRDVLQRTPLFGSPIYAPRTDTSKEEGVAPTSSRRYGPQEWKNAGGFRSTAPTWTGDPNSQARSSSAQRQRTPAPGGGFPHAPENTRE
jgi:hypothetical protein